MCMKGNVVFGGDNARHGDIEYISTYCVRIKNMIEADN